MCGRYAIWAIDDLGKRFLIVDPTLGFRSRFNIAPMTENPVIISDGDSRHLFGMTWGLWVPTSGKGAPSHPVANIRAESILEKYAWSRLFRTGRCIIPANGFYEWKNDNGRRTPYFFHLQNKEHIGIAGLYSCIIGHDGLSRFRYAVITTGSNDTISPVHNRMPAILRPEDEEAWLSSGEVKKRK